MGTGIVDKLRRRKPMFVRGAAFVLAALTVSAALFAGSSLREPSRRLPVPSPDHAAQDTKDETRVAGAIVRPPSEQAVAQTESHGANDSALTAAESGEWREEEFAFVDIVDGRTFHAGGITITLVGLELPPSDQVCRTLDDRLEHCTVRAATQLELLTRSRRLACRYRMTTSSTATGSCRMGAHDIAERMIRTGYARAGSGAVIAQAGEAEPSAR
jgi:endonuclease YncB( thermonuclease family)